MSTPGGLVCTWPEWLVEARGVRRCATDTGRTGELAKRGEPTGELPEDRGDS